MSHTASKTWTSDMTREFDRFLKVRNNYLHVAPKSPNVPRSYREWLAHRVFVQENAHQADLRQLRLRESQRGNGIKHIELAFAGKIFKDYRSPVLAMETIWLPSTHPHPERPVAPWPCNDELRCEGTTRSVSGYSRFPPLPRMPSNETVNWRQRAPIAPYLFDAFGRPSLKHTEAKPDTDDAMVFFVGESLLKEIDM